MESNSAPTPADRFIGQAWLEADSTIVLRLKATGQGMIGEGTLRYAPDHPQYGMILAHLGGLLPGETKPVRPFKNEKNGQ